MVFTTYGKERVAVRIGSNVGTPEYCGVGTGSSTKNDSTISLTTETVRSKYTSVSYATPKKLKYTTFFSSSVISGTNSVKEFGQFVSGTVGNGSTWIADGFTGITFDGTNELQIETTVNVL